MGPPQQRVLDLVRCVPGVEAAQGALSWRKLLLRVSEEPKAVQQATTRLPRFAVVLLLPASLLNRLLPFQQYSTSSTLNSTTRSANPRSPQRRKEQRRTKRVRRKADSSGLCERRRWRWRNRRRLRRSSLLVYRMSRTGRSMKRRSEGETMFAFFFPFPSLQPSRLSRALKDFKGR
jgi:hypothetical protein